jgi:hypothetical protein
MYAEIGVWITCVISTRLAIYELPVTVEKLVLADFDRGFPQLGFETKTRKLTHGMGKEGNSNTEGFQFRRRFINAAGKSSLFQ